MAEKRQFEQEKTLNSKCANISLSQQRGSPQNSVPGLCYYLAEENKPASEGLRQVNTIRTRCFHAFRALLELFR